MTILSLAALQSPTFLLNSRTPLVIETSTLCMSRHPFYLRYGARLPNSLTRVCSGTPWPSQPGAPFSVLGTETKDSWLHGFHGRPAFAKHCCSTSLFRFSSSRFSTELQRLNEATASLRIAHHVPCNPFVAEDVLLSYRNMNLFPFRVSRVTRTLRTD